MDILSLVISIVGVLLSIFIFRRQNKTQQLMDDFTKDTLNQLKSYEQTGFDLLVSLRNDNLRLFSKQLENEEKNYWHFKWRFETWDSFGLIINISENNNCHINVKVLGITSDFRNNSFDKNLSFENYICKVIESSNEIIFSKGEIVACFYFNESGYVSKYAGLILTPEDKYKFQIIGLGNSISGTEKDRLASMVNYNERAKDFKIK